MATMTLQEMLAKKQPAKQTTASAPAQMTLEVDGPRESAAALEAVAAVDASAAADMLMGLVESVELEAVIGGALMRLKLKGGQLSPVEVLPLLKAVDPNVKVRDDFPSKNFGKRDSKLTRAMVINLDASRNGSTFIDIICQNGDDLKVGVSKKHSDGFVKLIGDLGKVSAKNITKLAEAQESKKSATVILTEEEQFGVLYWTTDDGKAFLEGVQAAPPAAEAAHE
jgi:hypothetical protein